MRIRDTFGCFCVMILAACATSGTEPDALTTYYSCERDIELQVDYLEGDAVLVRAGDAEAIELPLVPSASGSKYMTPRHSFWAKGDEAMWTIGRMAPVSCSRVDAPDR